MVTLDVALPTQRTCIQPEVVGTTRVVLTVRRRGGAAAVPEHRTNGTRLHFLVTADWGGLPVWPWATPGQRKVAAALGRVAQARRSAFILSLGDHFYFHGVRSADDPRWHRTFDSVFTAPSLQGAGFWRIAAGNHDHEGNISAQLAYAAQPGSRWRYPALQHAWREVLVPSEKKTAEAGSSGDFLPAASGAGGSAEPEVVVGFVLIDTVMLCGRSSSEAKPVSRATLQRFGGAERHWAWVEAALGRMEDADYVVVGGHYPIESPSSHGPCGCLRSRLVPLLSRHRASVYFSGHDHTLFHIDPAMGQRGTGITPGALPPGKARKGQVLSGSSRGPFGISPGCSGNRHGPSGNSPGWAWPPGQPAPALHGVGAGFTASASVAHIHTCDHALRFHYRGDGRLRALGGGFAGVQVSARALVVTHYDAHGRRLYSHSVRPRGRG